MKIDKVTTESHSTLNPISPEKILKDQHHVESADAVVFEGERNQKETSFKRQEQEAGSPEPDLESSEEQQQAPKTKRLLDVIV